MMAEDGRGRGGGGDGRCPQAVVVAGRGIRVAKLLNIEVFAFAFLLACASLHLRGLGQREFGFMTGGWIQRNARER